MIESTDRYLLIEETYWLHPQWSAKKYQIWFRNVERIVDETVEPAMIICNQSCQCFIYPTQKSFIA